jgi:hypothetical protein
MLDLATRVRNAQVAYQRALSVAEQWQDTADLTQTIAHARIANACYAIAAEKSAVLRALATQCRVVVDAERAQRRDDMVYESDEIADVMAAPIRPVLRLAAP